MTKKETPDSRGREVSEVDEMAAAIVTMFEEFGTPVEMIEAIAGHSSYHFHIRPKKAVRMKAFAGYIEDLKYALSTDSIEIQAPIPNQKLIGIIVQKKTALPTIYFKDALAWEELADASPLSIPLGVDEFGTHQVADIATMPHLLMGGTTGSGKSVILHSFLNGLIERNTPETLRLILVDPKRIEFTAYNGLPHLLTPTITHAKKTIQALSWAVKEMERRYDILEAAQVQNIKSYHQTVYQPALQDLQKKGKKEDDRVDLPEVLPYIVIVVDELNDLMQAYPRELEACIVRLAQMSRAVGIHMIISTQRPSTNVITGSIKANIPSRIALMVASQVDSRTIIDTPGAEKLRGSGDILYLGSDTPQPVRLQGLYISEDEIRERVIRWIESGDHNLDSINFGSSGTSGDSFGGDGEDDDLYEDAKRAVLEAGKASTSFLQRTFRVGYSRAARILDLLEERGVIGKADGSKPREVI